VPSIRLGAAVSDAERDEAAGVPAGGISPVTWPVSAGRWKTGFETALSLFPL
jgi:hypothetical protein